MKNARTVLHVIVGIPYSSFSTVYNYLLSNGIEKIFFQGNIDPKYICPHLPIFVTSPASSVLDRHPET
jgi:hypothetical protein